VLLYPWGNRHRYPLDRRLGGPQSRFGRNREEKARLCRELNPARPTRSKLIYRLRSSVITKNKGRMKRVTVATGCGTQLCTSRYNIFISTQIPVLNCCVSARKLILNLKCYCSVTTHVLLPAIGRLIELYELFKSRFVSQNAERLFVIAFRATVAVKAAISAESVGYFQEVNAACGVRVRLRV
jgi:hypothetical protein